MVARNLSRVLDRLRCAGRRHRPFPGGDHRAGKRGSHFAFCSVYEVRSDQPESEVNQNAALQFSADIQTLMDSDLAPEIYWQDGQAVCYMAEKFYGKDKFEAVRKAVESLKQPAQV